MTNADPSRPASDSVGKEKRGAGRCTDLLSMEMGYRLTSRSSEASVRPTRDRQRKKSSQVRSASRQANRYGYGTTNRATAFDHQHGEARCESLPIGKAHAQSRR